MKTIPLLGILKLLVIIYGLFVILNLLINVNINFWDFKVYYYSVICFIQDLNPYSTADLSSVINQKWNLPYAYPPLTLNFFKLFCFGGINNAAITFLLFKLILTASIVLIWNKLLQNKKDILFYIFILLTFNSTVYLDLRAGNITIIMQFLLWIGFYFYTKKKYLLFCIFIILASAFKLIPIFFLILLLFTQEKRKYLYFIGSSLVFISYLFLNYLIYPAFSLGFINIIFFNLQEVGSYNPALFPFIKDLVHHLIGNQFGSAAAHFIDVFIYAFLVILISMVTYKSFLKISVKNSLLYKDKEQILIFLLCLVYSFVMPRFKDYDYILLIVPAYFIIRRIEFIKTKHMLIFICVISSVQVTLPGFKLFYRLMWDYYPLFLASLIWVLYMVYIKKMSNSLDNGTMCSISSGDAG